MNLKLSVVVLCLLFFASCNSKETGSTTNAPANSTSNSATNSSTSPAANNPAAVKSKLDPCSLLTSNEIKLVQGEAFANAMRSDRQDGDFIVGQCYYALPTSVNSVVVNVTTAKDTAGAPNPRDFWEGTFGKEAGEGNDQDKKREKEKPKKPEADLTANTMTANSITSITAASRVSRPIANRIPPTNSTTPTKYAHATAGSRPSLAIIPAAGVTAPWKSFV